MNTEHTKHELFSLLSKNGTALMYLHGKPYILLGISREDGSGSSFILHLQNEEFPRNKFDHWIRTSD